MKTGKKVIENATLRMRISELTQRVEVLNDENKSLRQENDLLFETIDNLNEFIAAWGLQHTVKLRIV